MAVNPIAKSRFDALVDTRTGLLKRIEEKAWFATDGEKSLGTVIFDRNDNDWAYVIMERADDKRFRYVEGNSSIANQQKATDELLRAMEARSTHS
jgi:hypothetical protein